MVGSGSLPVELHFVIRYLTVLILDHLVGVAELVFQGLILTPLVVKLLCQFTSKLFHV